jgi:glycosyltransferase involved in cell wall biosynthesis
VPVCERNKDWIVLKSALKNSPISFKKIPDFYNSIDVITCLSKGETGPNSLLEAGACGKPAVSVRVGVAEELIKNDFNGLLIERNEQALEKALRKLYNDKKHLKLMGQRMRQEVLKNWTRDKNISSYKKIFN